MDDSLLLTIYTNDIWIYAPILYAPSNVLHEWVTSAGRVKVCRLHVV